MKAYKFKLRPSPRIACTFERWLDVCRELYNAGLAERREAHKKCGISISYNDQARQLPEVKTLREDIAQVHSQVLQDILRRLSKAFDAFFRRVKTGDRPGYPRFKGSHRFTSFTYPQARSAFRIVGSRLHLSKIGKVKIIQHRPIEGEIKTCTIKRQTDGWYAIFAVEENQSRYLSKTGGSIGLDVGIENFATLSDGEVIENPKYLRAAERRLKSAQRKLSRRKKGSARRRKAAQLLARQHQRIANQRHDFHHKMALSIVRNYDAIAVEDLSIGNLLKNHHLAKSISDAAWGAFLSILESKAANAGKRVWRVPPQFTSQDCSGCGNRVRKTLAVREHRCVACGLIVHRDHNAALNIKKKGEGIAFSKRAATGSRRPENLPASEREAARL